VKKHLENIFRKLGVKTRTAAALSVLVECWKNPVSYGADDTGPAGAV